MSYEEVVFKRSYLNILLLNRSIPSYDFDEDENGDSGNAELKKPGYTKVRTKFKNESELFMSLM